MGKCRTPSKKEISTLDEMKYLPPKGIKSPSKGMKSPSKEIKLIDYGKVRFCRRKISINEDDSPRSKNDESLDNEDLDQSWASRLNDSVTHDFAEEEEEELEFSFNALNISKGDIDEEKETPTRKVSSLKELCHQTIDQDKINTKEEKQTMTFGDIFAKLETVKKSVHCLPTAASFAPYLPNVDTQVVWRSPTSDHHQEAHSLVPQVKKEQDEDEDLEKKSQSFECDACLEIFTSKQSFKDHIKETKSDFVHKVWGL